jgi:hypothetical protein
VVGELARHVGLALVEATFQPVHAPADDQPAGRRRVRHAAA